MNEQKFMTLEDKYYSTLENKYYDLQDIDENQISQKDEDLKYISNIIEKNFPNEKEYIDDCALDFWEEYKNEDWDEEDIIKWANDWMNPNI